MKCFEREQLFAYAHRMLGPQEAAEVHAHVEACSACQQVVADYLRLDAALDEWKSIEPSAWFDARVRQAVKAQGETRALSRWSGLTWARWLAPASLAVLVGVVALVTYRSHRIWGPTAPESAPQRISTPEPHTQPSAENSQPVDVEKKTAPSAETAQAKNEASLKAKKWEAPVQSEQLTAGARNAPSNGGLQSSSQTGGKRPVPSALAAAGGPSRSALRPAGAAGPAAQGAVQASDAAGFRAPSTPKVAVENQQDFLTRTKGEREAAAQPSTAASAGRVSAMKVAEEDTAQRRQETVAPSTVAEARQAPTVAAPLPSAPAPSMADAQAQVVTGTASHPSTQSNLEHGKASGASRPYDAAGQQMLGTPAVAPPAVKMLYAEKARVAAKAGDEEDISLYQNLKVLENLDLFSDFDVLSELPRRGKKIDN